MQRNAVRLSKLFFWVSSTCPRYVIPFVNRSNHVRGKILLQLAPFFAGTKIDFELFLPLAASLFAPHCKFRECSSGGNRRKFDSQQLLPLQSQKNLLFYFLMELSCRKTRPSPKGRQTIIRRQQSSERQMVYLRWDDATVQRRIPQRPQSYTYV